MEVFLNKKFEKMFKRCPPEIQQQFIERLKLFRNNPYNLILNNHCLSGKLKGLNSINISGDWRIIFKKEGENIILVAIGTHSQLYK